MGVDVVGQIVAGLLGVLSIVAVVDFGAAWLMRAVHEASSRD